MINAHLNTYILFTRIKTRVIIFTKEVKPMRGPKRELSNEWILYFAILTTKEDGYVLEFPDLPGAIVNGTNSADINAIVDVARETLAAHIIQLEEASEPFPTASMIIDINAKMAQATNKIAIAAEIYLPLYRDKIRKESVNKNVTVPRWLDDLASRHNINYSQTLQEALKKKLGFDL